MRVLPWAAALLSAIIWRNGRVIKNILILKADFPVGYFAHGNFSTQCQTLGGIVDDDTAALKYCEDVTFWDILDKNGKLHERKVIMSCDPGRHNWNTVMGPLRDPAPRGALWMYTPGSTRPKPIRLEFEEYPVGHDFHPLGIEVWPSFGGNSSYLYAINHARERTVIEQFLVSPSGTHAKYIRTLSSPYFISPNSLALTSPTSFYVTNDHLMTRRLPSPLGQVLPVVETILGLPLGWVSHIKIIETPSTVELQHSVAALGIPFANGISLSHDGSQLAVSSSSLAQIHFYTRTEANNSYSLKYTHSIAMPFSPDNIAFTHSKSNVLIAAGHPHFPSLTAVAASPPGPDTRVSPSWVVSLTPRPSPPTQEYDLAAPISASSKAPGVAGHEIETLFQSNGTGFSSSATGLLDENTGALYVSGLYAEEGVLVCK